MSEEQYVSSTVIFPSELMHASNRAKHTVMPWFVQFGIDLLVVTLTVARTWRFPRDGEGLPQIVRRDGTAYFG
jgi:hypothetical protein